MANPIKVAADPKHAIFDAWRRWRAHHSARLELAACDEGVLAGIAREFELTVAEVRELAELGPGSTNLLYARLHTLGIDSARLDAAPLLRVDMERCCARCDHKAECAHDLQTAPPNSGYTRYCPNALTLASLQEKSPA